VRRAVGRLRPLALALLAFAGRARAGETGFLDRTVAVRGGEPRRYQVYVPANRPAGPLPVILFLHGAGERGSDGLLQTAVGLGAFLRRDAARFPAIVVFPQVPQGQAWDGDSAEAAMEALRRTQAEFRTDPDRVYLTGMSMGGRGSWYLAHRHPGVFAAVAPVCGWVTELPFRPYLQPVVPKEAGDPLKALAKGLGRTPVWIFHGEMDDVVPVEGSREPARVLKELGCDVRYTELPGVGHNAWDPAYGSKAFTDWLFAQRRPAP